MSTPEPYSLVAALSGGTVLQAAAMLLGFIALLFVGSALLPGRRVTGPDAEGNRRVYKLNGLALFLIVAVAAGLGQMSGMVSLSVLHTHFLALFVVANGFAFALAGWLFFRGARSREESQVSWRKFFMGVEAGPTWFGLDLKLFSYCPSLIGLALFNASFAAVQYETYGGLTLGMALYQIFAFLYVLNYFQFEQGMIHTWDIVSERFGWNLVWGDYVLVPFFYCFPGWWLVHAPETLSPAAAVPIVLLFLFGFWLFRGANQQKHRFKRDPDIEIWGKPARTLDGRLLVSGFWGIGRHLNYTGEICIYLSFALTAGLASWFPFLLPAWLAGLLWHRSRRDERRCRAKYGALWDRYTKTARFSMLPFIH